jgi:predicted RNase H-like nuclease (RuvC/YqgF family)
MITDEYETEPGLVIYELGHTIAEQQETLARQERELKALRRQVRAFRRAVAPLLDGLNFRPRATHYYLRADHAVVQRLARVYRLTNPKEEQHEPQA